LNRKGDFSKVVCCPQCGSQKTWKDGLRKTDLCDVQRFLCRVCGYRFSESKIKFDITGQIFERSKATKDHPDGIVTRSNSPSKKLSDSSSFSGSKQVCSHDVSTAGKNFNSLRIYSSEQQVCANKGAKNLNSTETKTVVGDKKTNIIQVNPTVKGKLLEYEFWMQKQGYAESTIKLNRTCLKMMILNNANLLDPESVKVALLRYKASQNRKRNVINAYSQFLKLNGITWAKPKCKVIRKFPFIPLEKEIDALISGSGPKTATFLQLLKETAMRCGEAKRIEWIDTDFEKGIITLNTPEKGSNARMWKVTAKLMGMISLMPHNCQKIFGNGPINSLKTTFLKTRKRLASKLQNPRLLKISFHTLRHWKATELYHKTKDPYYVKDFLGHKELRSTEIYINIERTIFAPSSDDFTVKIAQKPDEIKALLEVGFEYVCEKDNLIFMKKRK